MCVCVWSCVNFIVYLTGKRHTKLEYQYLCPRTPFDPFNSFDLVILGSRGGTWCCVGDKMFFCSHALPLAIAEDEEKRHTAVRETTLFFFCRQLSFLWGLLTISSPIVVSPSPRGQMSAQQRVSNWRYLNMTSVVHSASSVIKIKKCQSLQHQRRKVLQNVTLATRLDTCLLDSFGHNH